MASNVYNPFRPKFGNNGDRDETLERLNARFMRLASRHAAKGKLSSTARIEPVAASDEHSTSPVYHNPIHNNFVKTADISSFRNPFDYKEEPEANQVRIPRKLRKSWNQATTIKISLAPSTTLSRMKGIVEGAQPAVVKMSGTGGAIRSATNMVRYVSRDAAMPMERENGRQITTLSQQNDMLEEWSHFFDKRQPSRDVVTLTVDINDSGISVKDVQNALESIYEKQRIVFGRCQDSYGHSQLIAVLTIASKDKGRIKTTDHALQQVATQLQKDYGIDTAGLNLF